MDPRDYIIARLQLWAARRGICLGSQYRHSPDEDERQRGDPLFVYDLEDNLFEPLIEEVRLEFENGDGGELVAGSNEGNLYAIHSSSALVCNVFHFWKRRCEPDRIAQALRIPSKRIESIEFEVQCPILDRFERAPNIDVVFRYTGQSKEKIIGIESKFTEPFGRGHPGIRPLYFGDNTLWEGLSHLRQLAEEISPHDNRYEHLHAAQLIKHVLGLRNAAGEQGFRLVYLFYDGVGEPGGRHRHEIEDFTSIAESDGVKFQAISYQKVLSKLADQQRAAHPRYVDYLIERYF